MDAATWITETLAADRAELALAEAQRLFDLAPEDGPEHEAAEHALAVATRDYVRAWGSERRIPAAVA